MGKTGETFIVGPDDLMRSDSRLFLEDPEAYKRDVVEAGTPPDVAEEAIRQHGTTLVQPVATEATKLAQRGQRGTLIADDYLGQETLQAYAPADIPGLRWKVIAKIDTSEAFAPVRLHPEAGAVDGGDHLRRSASRRCFGEVVRASDPPARSRCSADQLG